MSHTLYDILAPAKLNLFLHITGRRDDGYHLLQSVFMLINWYDTLHIECTANAEITRTDLSAEEPHLNNQPENIQKNNTPFLNSALLPATLPADDLCVRAARALQTATGCTQGAHIYLRKSIAQQAGMGGGSSDAASVLIALNRLWNLRLSRAQLAAIGLKLGADVPFFVHGRNAWVEGVGERITPLQGAAALPAAQFVVIKPRQGVETARIFAHPQLRRNTAAATIADFSRSHYDFGHNDLQSVAQSLCTDIGQAIDYLAGKNVQAKMTGSGSAVFAKISQPLDLSDLPENWTARICENLPVHPMENLIFPD